MAMPDHTIAELSALSGVSVRTIRYYVADHELSEDDRRYGTVSMMVGKGSAAYFDRYSEII